MRNPTVNRCRWHCLHICSSCDLHFVPKRQERGGFEFRRRHNFLSVLISAHCGILLNWEFGPSWFECFYFSNVVLRGKSWYVAVTTHVTDLNTVSSWFWIVQVNVRVRISSFSLRSTGQCVVKLQWYRITFLARLVIYSPIKFAYAKCSVSVYVPLAEVSALANSTTLINRGHRKNRPYQVWRS